MLEISRRGSRTAESPILMGESFQDFEADFPQKVSLKMLNNGDHNSLFDLFSVCLRTFDHLNLKLRIFRGHTANFKIGVAKVQDFC